MNKIDYENIQRELDSRKVKFKNGGELSTAEIKIKTTEELKRILEESKKTKPIDWVEKLKESVDKAFSMFGNNGEQAIVLEVLGVFKNKYSYIIPTVSSEDDFGMSLYYDMCVSDIICCLEELKKESCRGYIESNDLVNIYKNAFTVMTKDYEYKIFLIDKNRKELVKTIKQF